MEEEKTILAEPEPCLSDLSPAAEAAGETSPEPIPQPEAAPEMPTSEPADPLPAESAADTDADANPDEKPEPAPSPDGDPDSAPDLAPLPLPNPDSNGPEAPEPLPLTERLDRLEKLMAAYEAQRQQQEEDQKLRAHFDGLYRQGEELKASLPNFDLGRELENPLFARLTAPDTGLTVLQAWACAHAEELAAPKAPVPNTPPRAPHVDNRPAESGLGAQGATLSRFDYRQLSREQRENIKTAVRNARATGEKLYPPGS